MSRMVIETFKPVSSYGLSDLSQPEPSCFNGLVRVTKYRITVEEIAEPDDVIRERIQRMWDATTNPHHRIALRKIAKQYGMAL